MVGYLPIYRALPTHIPLDTLTHLNLAFAAPQDTGADTPIDFVFAELDAETLPESKAEKIRERKAQIKVLVGLAHDKHVQVLGSIGGGTLGATATEALKENPESFVRRTIAFLDGYGLDGIDIDIEGEAIDSDSYEKLVTGLAAQLLPTGKLLTAAVANYKADQYRALEKLNFLNIMSYDQCGPTWGERGCDHSTSEQAGKDLESWGSKYGKANVVLGVPFYGYCWGSGCSALDCVYDKDSNACAMTYANALALWSKGNANTPVPDRLLPDSPMDETKNYFISLNGPDTIANKAKLAKSYGGIMIWELSQDASGEKSLVSVIEKAR